MIHYGIVFLQERHQYRDTAVIQESLEKLQGVIAANSLNQVLERIETACQKLGLKFSQNAQVDSHWMQFVYDKSLGQTLFCPSMSSIKLYILGCWLEY